MTLLLPSGAPFGRLEVDDVWIRIDGPRLFVARNRSGGLFVFNAVDEDDDSVSYVAVPASNERVTQLKSGGLPLRTAFVEPEDGVAFVVNADYTAETVEWWERHPAEFLEYELPSPATRLAFSVPTHERFDRVELGRRAVSEGRTLLALRLDPPQLLRTEYPVRELSDSLLILQALTEALVQEEADGVTQRGPLPRQVVEDAELAVLDLRAASFVAVLASSPPQPADAPSPPLGLEFPGTRAALKHLVRLVSAASDEGVLRAEFADLGRRALAKTKDFFEVAVDQHAAVGLYLAESSGEVSEAVVDEVAASRAILILTQADEGREEIALDDATLVGINLRTGVFELHSATREPYRFSGKMTETARAQVEGLPTGDEYRYFASIEATTALSDLTDEIKIKYSLQSIQPWELASTDRS